jgi:hypothetical protein
LPAARAVLGLAPPAQPVRSEPLPPPQIPITPRVPTSGR